MRNDINIAILAKHFLNWGGGIDFLRNCTSALLLKGKGDAMRLSLLFPERTTRGKLMDSLYPYKKIFTEIVRFRKPHFYRIKPIARDALMDSLILNNNNLTAVSYRDEQGGLLSCLVGIKADVILPLAETPGASFAYPWLGYIPDLQHKNLPHFFSNEECANRERIFSGLLRDAKAVIVNSHAVKSDIEKFYPEFRCRVFPLPFAPVPLPGWFDEDPAVYKRKYDLPDRYFIISNQFWVHKSHITAFEALYNLKKIYPSSDVHVVCTGDMRDYRFPKYFEELKIWIDQKNLSKNIHFLGYIPKKDQLQILRGAIALLQPTLFEGGPGGGAVYDAVALGVPSIVSDIPVNKEILGENVFFFQSGSSDDIKEKMLKTLEVDIQRPSKEVLIEQGHQRAEKLGNALCKAIEFVI